MEARELRLYNIVNCLHHHNNEPIPEKFNIPVIITAITQGDVVLSTSQRVFLEDLSGIPITEEWLLRMGFEKEKHYTVNNGLKLSIGRNRFLTVGCVGTQNEMVFLIDVDDENSPSKVLNIITLRNYDYDGKTYVHHIQNIAHYLTGTEIQTK